MTSQQSDIDMTIKNTIIHRHFGQSDWFTLFLLLIIGIVGFFQFYEKHAIRIALLIVISLLLIITSWIYYRTKQSANNTVVSNRIFPACFLIIGLISCALFPPGSIPDELYHFRSSYGISNLLMGKSYNTMRVCDQEFLLNSVVPDITGDNWGTWYKGAVLSSPEDNVDTTEETLLPVDLASNSPQVRLIPALGITAGRLVGLSSPLTFLLGKTLYYIYCASIIIIAVRLMPLGKSTLMTLSMLPMSLMLLGSYSYDGITIALSFLSLALSLRIWQGETNNKNLLISIIIAFLLCPCKIVYTIIPVTLFFVPLKSFSSAKQGWLFRLILALSLLLALIVRAVAESSYTATMDELGLKELSGVRVENGEPYTLNAIILNPLYSIMVFIRTIYYRLDMYLTSTVGQNLGWFQGNIPLPTYMVFAWIALAILSSIRSDRASESNIPSLRWKFLSIICFVISSCAIIASMWVGHTFINETIVDGVQGRYFIPILPLLLLPLCYRKAITISARASYPILISCIALDFVGFSHITLLL